MAKVLKGRFLPPDDPIFSGGVELFSPLVSTPSSKTSQTDTTGEAQVKGQKQPAPKVKRKSP